MDIETISLNDYICAGKGANGTSYNSKSDPDVMLKMYDDKMGYLMSAKEAEVARKVYDAGIASPEPGSVVTDGEGHYGIRFRRLRNKISFARAIGTDPANIEKYSRDFARLCLKLHSTKVSTVDFPSVKDQYLTMLGSNKFFNDAEKAKLEDIIKRTPDADTAIHGDLHFGNALIVGDKFYFIDIAEFAYGNPLFDLGMTSLSPLHGDTAFLESEFHMTRGNAVDFWKYFSDEYFGGKLSPAEADELVLPYVVLKSLLIERNMNERFEPGHELLKKV